MNEVRQNNVQRQPVVQQVVSNHNSDINSLVSAMSFSNVEVKMPKFLDENESHPLEFLDRLDKFFRIKNISADKKMSAVEIALDGNARLWLDLQNDFENYEAFKVAFQARFFSVPIQVKVKSNWVTREYNERRDGNFLNFYYQQYKEASYIRPIMTEYEKNYMIMKQFPWWVQEALASANFNDASTIAHTLTNLDTIRLEKQIRREHRQTAQNNNYGLSNHQNSQNVVSVQSLHASKQNYNNRHSRRNNGRYNSNRHGYYNNSLHPTHNNSSLGNSSVASGNMHVLPDTRYPPPNIPINTQNNQNNGNTNLLTNTESNNLNFQATR